jgi:dihydroorotate dehydrogenase (NAD+) catalytic subunit
MSDDCSTIHIAGVALRAFDCDNSKKLDTPPQLHVDLAPTRPGRLVLRTPVMPASGTFGYGTEYADLIPVATLGAVVTKGITATPWTGNPQPRLWETAAGMLNTIGLENIGVEVAIAEKAPLWATWDVPVIVNIAGHTVDEYVEVARRLDGVAGVAALEVNISCPNVAQGGLEFGTDPAAAASVTKAVRAATDLPIIVKLSPNVGDIVAIAVAVQDAGADALCVANTLRGTAIDAERRVFRLGREAGGLSGPCIKPVALHLVHRVARAVTLPVVGCGGISTSEDALEFIIAGASAVQAGTATFTDPGSLAAITTGIAAYLSRHSLQRLDDIRGIV